MAFIVERRKSDVVKARPVKAIKAEVIPTLADWNQSSVGTNYSYHVSPKPIGSQHVGKEQTCEHCKLNRSEALIKLYLGSRISIICFDCKDNLKRVLKALGSASDYR